MIRFRGSPGDKFRARRAPDRPTAETQRPTWRTQHPSRSPTATASAPRSWTPRSRSWRRRARGSRSRRSRSARRSTCAATRAGIEPSRLGFAAPHQGLPQGADHHAPGRRLQEPERHDAQDARPLRQRPAVRLLPPVRRRPSIPIMDVVIVRENEEDLYAGHRVPADRPTSMQCLKLITRPGSREDRPLRLRVRAPQQPQEGHLLHQRQHHEDDRRPVPQGLRRDRRASTPTSRRSTGSSTSARPSWPTRPRPSTSS